MKTKTHSVGIIGSGNIAFHLAKELCSKEQIQLIGIHSRNQITGRELATSCKTDFYNSLNDLSHKCQIILICSSDDSIPKIAAELKLEKQILAHCSGMISINSLKEATPNYGSFYPLQSFTKSRKVDFQSIPILIDASNSATLEILREIASLCSQKVQDLDDEKRRKLHLAAVLVNNFSNHLFALAKEYTEKQGLDFQLLKPLLQETVLKAIEEDPRTIQTGPARRGDVNTIAQHELMLKDEKIKEIYSWFTKSIKDFYA